tara:strand:+ start:246 stop:377 length:132 start_codon:yes stop_codon:yes gene_type:complete
MNGECEKAFLDLAGPLRAHEPGNHLLTLHRSGDYQQVGKVVEQ